MKGRLAVLALVGFSVLNAHALGHLIAEGLAVVATAPLHGTSKDSEEPEEDDQVSAERMKQLERLKRVSDSWTPIRIGLSDEAVNGTNDVYHLLSVPWERMNVCGLDAEIFMAGACEMYGIQAGLVAEAGDVDGMQVGLMSDSGDVNGFQIGGYGSDAQGDVNGLQLGGYLSGTQGGVNGFQIAGLLCMNNDGMNGVQVGGFGCCSTNGMNGVQISGLLCGAEGMANGLQIAGLVCMSKTEMNGLQISCVNLAPRSHGLQIGLYNRVKSGACLQIGLWNKGSKISLPFLNWTWE